MASTAFLWDEKTFWHSGGNYAMLVPVGGLVQPFVSGGLPEAPETKRRLRNLIAASGIEKDLALDGAAMASMDQLLRIHPKTYLDQFKELSDGRGGELGLRTPFGPGAFEIAALSAGLAIRAVEGVAKGEFKNAYALSRPPGHHCLPDWPNGFCLLANIAIAIESAKAIGLVDKVAVIDWDVHHGNGTENIFYERNDVLTISVHQDRCYPQNTGFAKDTGTGLGTGCNINVPLVPGCGHNSYLEVMDRIVVPAVSRFKPDLVIIANGFDAAAVDPLSRMMCTAETFRAMTKKLMEVVADKIVAVHEGGYSELYVPFCGHAMLEQMSGSTAHVEDPLEKRLRDSQPDLDAEKYYSSRISELVEFFDRYQSVR